MYRLVRPEVMHRLVRHGPTRIVVFLRLTSVVVI
jgi:hypothetical protein